MSRYNSRHRKLMDASEYALRDATVSQSSRASRIAATVVQDSQKYRIWEARHADLLLPVAEHRAKKHQVVALRNAGVELVHRRALFKHIRTRNVQGETRRRLFRLIHTTRDYEDAILAEHRQYMVAVSSRISTNHIVDIMDDELSRQLLDQYETLYGRYFDMRCYVAMARDSCCIELVRESMQDVRRSLMRVRDRIETERPASGGGNFERQELLARSGRYQALNYLNR